MAKQPSITYVEKCAGKTADFLVYYRTKAGKLCYDAVYKTNLRREQNAGDFIKAAVRGATVLKVLNRAPGAEIQ